MAGAGDQPKTIKRKSKKENDKAPVELELAPPSGMKFKRVRCTKDQMAMDALVKKMELSLKVGCTPSQELLKSAGVIPKEEGELAMGMDNPTNLDCRERENFHEDKPPYEEAPSELGVKTPHIVSFTIFNTPLPQEEKEEERGGRDEEEEELTMDEADEEERKEGETRSGRSRLECFTPERGGTSKLSS
jgi:hypothetical protein